MTFNKNRFAILYSCLTAVLSVSFEGLLNAELPPDAQEAVKKGVIAAKQEDYLLAVRFFQDARKIDPEASEILYDLGLAESKIPGRELRAISWFGAYLAANPSAPNVAAVKEEIEALEVKNQSNISHLIKTVHEAAMQIPKDDDREARLVAIPKLWAASGNIDAAFKIAATIRSKVRNALAKEGIVEAQLDVGDIAGAHATAALIQDADIKSNAEVTISFAEAKIGDVPAAKQTFISALKAVDHIHTLFLNKEMAKKSFALALAKAGDFVDAEKTADSIDDKNDRSQAHNEIDEARGDVAKARAEAGDISGAQKNGQLVKDPRHRGGAKYAIVNALVNAGDIEGAQKNADLIEDINSPWKAMAETAIATRQVDRGSISAAEKTAELMKDASEKSRVQFIIVKAQVKAGDIASAQKTAGVIQHPEWKISAEKCIAEAQKNAGSFSRESTKDGQPRSQPVIPGFEWIKLLDDDRELNAPIFLDLADSLKSFSSNNSEQLCYALGETARTIVNMHNDVVKMLKQQAGQQSKG